MNGIEVRFFGGALRPSQTSIHTITMCNSYDTKRLVEEAFVLFLQVLAGLLVEGHAQSRGFPYIDVAVLDDGIW